MEICASRWCLKTLSDIRIIYFNCPPIGPIVWCSCLRSNLLKGLLIWNAVISTIVTVVECYWLPWQKAFDFVFLVFFDPNKYLGFSSIEQTLHKDALWPWIEIWKGGLCWLSRIAVGDYCPISYLLCLFVVIRDCDSRTILRLVGIFCIAVVNSLWICLLCLSSFVNRRLRLFIAVNRLNRSILRTSGLKQRCYNVTMGPLCEFII